MSYNDLIYKKRDIPVYREQNAGLENKAQAQMFQNINNTAQDIIGTGVKVIAMLQDLDANNKLVEKQALDEANLRELQIKYQNDPTNENFKKEVKTLYDNTTNEAMKNIGFMVKSNYEIQYKENFKNIEKNLDRWQFIQQLKNAQVKLQEQNHIANNNGYNIGRNGDWNNAESFFNNYAPNLEKNYKLIYGEFGFEDYKKALRNDYYTNVISGLIETNPTLAQEKLEELRKNNIIDGVVVDKLKSIAGDRIIEIDKWNTSKDLIAGDVAFKNILLKIRSLDGASIQDVNNFIEMSPKLPQNQKEFLLKELYGTSKNKVNGNEKTSKKAVDNFSKQQAFNELEDMYIGVISSVDNSIDSKEITKSINLFNQKLNEYSINDLISNNEYKDFNEKIKVFENGILESRYERDFNKKRFLFSDYKAPERLNETINNMLKPIAKSNNIDEDNFEDFLKTDKTAINLKHYMYKNVGVIQNELIKERIKEFNKISTKPYDINNIKDFVKKELTKRELENIQDVAIQEVKRNYLLKYSIISEEEIKKNGVNQSMDNYIKMVFYKNNQQNIAQDRDNIIKEKFKNRITLLDWGKIDLKN